jgi:hypothetical protein
MNAVSGAALMASCAVFAQRVKLSGTADELASMHTIKAALDRDGYRTTLISHPAYISLPGTARVDIDGQPVAAITHSFSLASPAPGLTGEIVYLGEGRPADFAGRNLHGRIVLVEGIANPAVAALARAAGATGQLHISPHEHLHEMCISPVWGSPGVAERAAMPATITCTISQADGAALRNRLAQGEAPVVTLHAEVDTGWRETPILVAEMDAPNAADDSFVLFSGHHDTWYFGVMDNGSANATMLECARVLAGSCAAWKRGLRLCFWSGHSHGRYSGSAWYVDNHWDELERRCAVHVNIDSTGAVGATVMTESAAAAELTPLAAIVIHQETGAVHEGRRPNRNSDMSFWGIGIPSLFGSLSMQPPSPAKMRNALGWWWHTPHDLLDKIDEANLVRDTRIFTDALWRLLTDPVLPLDYTAHADSLLAELATIEASLNGALSLEPLIQAATALRAGVATLRASGRDPASQNHILMRLSRALVPADYTLGDRFRHDPALPQSPWPVLDPIRALASADPASHPFARVDATRARNRMLHALREAQSVLG